ncbi:MAG TPA: hypothetical protein VF230_17145 [Acidimicrobiales bacterium]
MTSTSATVEALRAARDALFELPHPEEPGEPLPSYASDVVVGDRGPTFWFDAADLGPDEARAITLALVRVIEARGISGTLSWPEAP